MEGVMVIILIGISAVTILILMCVGCCIYCCCKKKTTGRVYERSVDPQQMASLYPAQAHSVQEGHGAGVQQQADPNNGVPVSAYSDQPPSYEACQQLYPQPNPSYPQPNSSYPQPYPNHPNHPQPSQEKHLTFPPNE